LSEEDASFKQQVEHELQSKPPIAPRKFVPFPFPYHQIIEARVESLTNLGFGICRVPLPNENIISQETTPPGISSHHSGESDEDDDIDVSDHSISGSSCKGWVVIIKMMK